ncbi:MAG: single-stranded DNA-binding protein [Patescibacteria group bacterium]|nr:single-stranded DNA-binding protein [Patescibacteria group bacterium]
MGARSENLAVIIGNLTRDPEVRDTSGGHTVAGFGVATNREWVTSDGQKKEDTQLHEVVAWDGLAKVCEQFLVKGSKVYVRGRLQTRSWEDESGQRHYKTEIVADKVVVLDSRKPSGRKEEATEDVEVEEGSEAEDVDEDIVEEVEEE